MTKGEVQKSYVEEGCKQNANLAIYVPCMVYHSGGRLSKILIDIAGDKLENTKGQKSTHPQLSL